MPTGTVVPRGPVQGRYFWTTGGLTPLPVRPPTEDPYASTALSCPSQRVGLKDLDFLSLFVRVDRGDLDIRSGVVDSFPFPRIGSSVYTVGRICPVTVVGSVVCLPPSQDSFGVPPGVLDTREGLRSTRGSDFRFRLSRGSLGRVF